MRILIVSALFHPSIGGLETVMRSLAEELQAAGQKVKVVTMTPGPDVEGLCVVRRPGPLEMLRLHRWADSVMHACVNLKLAWPLAFARRPLILSHHTWYRRADGSISWRDRLKLRLCRHAWNAAPSRALADSIPAEVRVIPNPFRDDLFRDEGLERDRDLVFLGRLVSDKGADLLLEALEMLALRGKRYSLTVIGSGPEEPALRARARESRLEARFAGALAGEALCEALNRHRVMAVPSRWEEPFGLVALEGLACGCAVVGSSGGGLKEAIGDCGLLFRNGDAADLARALEEALEKPGPGPEKVRAHLAKHSRREAARRYIELFEEAASC